MKKTTTLIVLVVLIGLLLATGCFFATTKEISVFADVAAYPNKTVLAKGTLTFNPDKIVFIPRSADGGCLPVSKSSPVFGKNKNVQVIIKALKCGKNEIYYAFTIKYHGLPISFVVSHDNLEKLHNKTFRIQLDPPGEKKEIYFEGGLLEK